MGKVNERSAIAIPSLSADANYEFDMGSAPTHTMNRQLYTYSLLLALRFLKQSAHRLPTG